MTKPAPVSLILTDGNVLVVQDETVIRVMKDGSQYKFTMATEMESLNLIRRVSPSNFGFSFWPHNSF